MQFLNSSENGPSRHVIAGSGLIVENDGIPMVSERVQEELQARNPDLKIEWLASAWGMSGFVLKCRWKPNDPRWASVQSGQTPHDKAFDVEHRFPADCRSSDMLSYIEARWGERNIPQDPRAVAQKMIEEAQKMIRDADAAAVDQLVETSIRKTMDDSNHQRELVAEEAFGGTHTHAHPMIVSPIDLNDGPKRLL